MNTTYTLFGIKNCDTLKKARRWLEEQQIEYRFHDYRVDGLDAAMLQQFIDSLGWQAILNTRGTTWRKLSEEQKHAASNESGAKALMLVQPAIIKRPILQRENALLVGFSVDAWQRFINGENPCSAR